MESASSILKKLIKTTVCKAFSFHETKNITSGEGGLLVVNDDRLLTRAEIIWEKGTNRSSFFRGEVDKYGWVDVGSSFLPSEIIAAFLWAQLENLEKIQTKRKEIWNNYYNKLKDWRSEKAKEAQLPAYIIFHNAHLVSIARYKPSNLEDLEQINGLGKSKTEKYGIEIIEVLENA